MRCSCRPAGAARRANSSSSSHAGRTKYTNSVASSRMPLPIAKVRSRRFTGPAPSLREAQLLVDRVLRDRVVARTRFDVDGECPLLVRGLLRELLVQRHHQLAAADLDEVRAQWHADRCVAGADTGAEPAQCDLAVARRVE